LCKNNRIDEGIANLKQAELIYNQNFEEWHHRFISLYIRMSYAFEMNHEYDKALQYLIKSQKIAIKNPKFYVLYLYQFSPVEKLPFSIKTKDVHYYTQVLDLTKQLFGKDHIRVAHYHYLLGLVYNNIGDNNKARQHYQKALDIASKQQFGDKTLSIGNQKNIEIIQKHLRS
jgi:tetratricopeptide (TPR) repeat protein